MRARLVRMIALVAAVSAMVVLGAFTAIPAGASAHGSHEGWAPHDSHAVWVARHGADSPSCGAFADPCQTIGQGVSNASPGQTVIVRPGVYAEHVQIEKQVRLEGEHATIDATGFDQGIWVVGPPASGTTISGFTVRGATGEGILLTLVDHVALWNNRVLHNDQGAHTTAYPACEDQGPVPGDCGEAIHLQGVTNSRIVHNRVDHNVGGILITDEAGTTSGNLIASNVVVNNAEDCGITMPSHNPAFSLTDNVIEGNFIAHNGGAGVLLATPAPGMNVHHNLVVGNVIRDNGEGGVQLHAHVDGSTLNDNTIAHNWIGTNNTAGDFDSGDLQTTGIIVFSASGTVSGLSIEHNVISHDEIGIWLSAGLVDTTGISGNHFVHVAMPVGP
jgi:nitrous oxidase accessory protein NosD